MKLPHVTDLARPFMAALALVLTACSPSGSTDTPVTATATATATAPAQSYEEVATQGKGFTVGAMMGAHAVYVLFDPQCPHCGRLWEASIPLQSKVRFVWIPVAFLNAKSGPQGAALLSAENPAALMAEHEKSLLAGNGGISAITGASMDINRAIKKNTQLFHTLALESVPYILAKNVRTGQVVTKSGALETAALAAFLGVD